MSQSRILRARQAEYGDDMNRMGGVAFSSNVAAFQVVNGGAIPSGGLAYYLCNLVTSIGGNKTEGTAVTTTVNSSLIPVAVLSGSPVAGDYLIAKQVAGRWVSQKQGSGGGGGGGGAHIIGCACTSIPTTLTMTAVGPCDNVFQNCTIVYGPTPSDLSGLNLTANSFLSTESFVDDFSGCPYRYCLECDTIFFRLSRVYLPCYGGGAFHDASIYSWSIGTADNTCDPFFLNTGYIYSGGNSNCIVTISG